MKVNKESWLNIESYQQQTQNWPQSGKHIMAQFTDDYVVVYQAYRPAIGQFAAKHQYFGGEFSYSRMSWIKPNFLWMMYRSGWGAKPGQEIVLAIFLKRAYFETILSNAFPSTNVMNLDNAQWKSKVAATDVRLQWDPDHDPYGAKLERRAVQLGLRNDYLAPFKGEGVIRVEDISNFVATQRQHVQEGELEKLMTPAETPYLVNASIQQNLMMV